MARDVPIHEITLRKYEKPYDSSRREIIRKICLSIDYYNLETLEILS